MLPVGRFEWCARDSTNCMKIKTLVIATLLILRLHLLLICFFSPFVSVAIQSSLDIDWTNSMPWMTHPAQIHGKNQFIFIKIKTKQRNKSSIFMRRVDRKIEPSLDLTSAKTKAENPKSNAYTRQNRWHCFDVLLIRTKHASHCVNDNREERKKNKPSHKHKRKTIISDLNRIDFRIFSFSVWCLVDFPFVLLRVAVGGFHFLFPHTFCSCCACIVACKYFPRGIRQLIVCAVFELQSIFCLFFFSFFFCCCCCCCWLCHRVFCFDSCQNWIIRASGNVCICSHLTVIYHRRWPFQMTNLIVALDHSHIASDF